MSSSWHSLKNRKIMLPIYVFNKKNFSFYFEMPEDNCIQLVLGNPINLETFGQTINNEPFEPVQVMEEKIRKNKNPNFGASK